MSFLLARELGQLDALLALIGTKCVFSAPQFPTTFIVIQDMLARARSNQVKTGVDNVSFIEANIKSIPLEDGIADVVISNCVINLVPENDKPAVFVEMARLLKPGGRLAISDILARKTLSKDLRQSITLYVGCVAGASLKEDYERWLAGSGFGGKYCEEVRSFKLMSDRCHDY
jgi:SAM-dependent methyltransferase